MAVKYPGYEPSSEVLAAHNIPHLNSHFQSQSNEFGFNESYLTGLYTFSLFILAICCLLVLLFPLVLCCRYLVRCCCCCPDPYEDRPPDWKKIARVRILFFVILFAIFVINFFIFLGNDQISNGFTNLQNGITTIENSFNTVIAEAANEVAYALQMSSWVTSKACTTTIPVQYINSLSLNICENMGDFWRIIET